MCPLCIAVPPYAINTFVSPPLSVFLPFEMVFVQITRPTQSSISLLEQLASCNNNYLQLMKENAEFIISIFDRLQNPTDTK